MVFRRRRTTVRRKRFPVYRRPIPGSFKRRSIRKLAPVRPLRNLMIGFPSQKLVRMRYADYFPMPPGAITPIQRWSFSANSINDPDASGIGHRPLGWNEWNVFYEKYVVVSAKIRVTYQGGNASTMSMIAGLMVTDQSNFLPVSVNQIIEQGTTKYRHVSTATNGNAWNNVLTAHYNARKWHNVTDIKDCESLESNMNSDPTDRTYFNLYVANYTSDGTGNALQCYVVIDYVVLVKDPKPLTGS